MRSKRSVFPGFIIVMFVVIFSGIGCQKENDNEASIEKPIKYIQSIRVMDSTENVSEQYSYYYDESNRLERIEGENFIGGEGPEIHSFSYDPEDRVVGWIKEDSVHLTLLEYRYEYSEGTLRKKYRVLDGIPFLLADYQYYGDSVIAASYGDFSSSGGTLEAYAVYLLNDNNVVRHASYYPSMNLKYEMDYTFSAGSSPINHIGLPPYDVLPGLLIGEFPVNQGIVVGYTHNIPPYSTNMSSDILLDEEGFVMKRKVYFDGDLYKVIYYDYIRL